MYKPTILYAEDDQVTRENYTFALKKYFQEVYTAGDGKEALMIYHEKKPDVLLLDINMPYMDGLDVVETIRKYDKEIPILMLTAHSDREKLLKAIPLGLFEYLVKPIRDDVFRDTMRRLIEQIKMKDLIYLKDGFTWNQAYRELSYQQSYINLSEKENLLITILAGSVGHYFSQDILISDIWKDEEINASHETKLIQLIYRLHKKITSNTGLNILLVENSYALGYRLLIR